MECEGSAGRSVNKNKKIYETKLKQHGVKQ
jgi:hypothetical protein